jgi:preprotein translocase subunit SecB
MKINEIVNFPTQLIRVETVKINAEKFGEKVPYEFDIAAETKGEIVDEHTGKSFIKIKVKNKEFCIEEEKVGIFKFEDTILNEQSAVRFMEIQGVRILWSYIREDIYTISSKMLPSPIMIPTIDVLKTLEKAE